MVWYNGLSETLMTELIAKRDDILTATENKRIMAIFFRHLTWPTKPIIRLYEI